MCVDSGGRSGCKGIGSGIGDELGGESARSKRGCLQGVMGQPPSQCLFFGEGAGHCEISCVIIFCLACACSLARFFLMLGDVAGRSTRNFERS